MRASSQACIRRARLEPTPSIHTESELWIKNGAGAQPWQGLAARRRPCRAASPARRKSRSPGARRPLRCASIWSAMWCTLTIARSTPAAASRSSTWSISALPLSRTSGLGTLPLAGAMRVPRPALSTIAVVDHCRHASPVSSRVAPSGRQLAGAHGTPGSAGRTTRPARRQSRHCAGCARRYPQIRGRCARYCGLPSRWASRTKMPRILVLRCAPSAS